MKVYAVREYLDGLPNAEVEGDWVCSQEDTTVAKALEAWVISECVDSVEQVPASLTLLTMESLPVPTCFAPKAAVKDAVDLCLQAWADEYGDPEDGASCSNSAYNDARAAIGDAFNNLARTLKVTRYRQVGTQTLTRDDVVEILKREGVLE